GRGTRMERSVMGTRGWPYEECCAETKRRANGPPPRIPKERYIGRRPITSTIDDNRIIDRNIDVVRFNGLDNDVFGRSCIATIRRRGDPTNLLLLARLQAASCLRLFA